MKHRGMPSMVYERMVMVDAIMRDRKEAKDREAREAEKAAKAEESAEKEVIGSPETNAA